MPLYSIDVSVFLQMSDSNSNTLTESTVGKEEAPPYQRCPIKETKGICNFNRSKRKNVGLSSKKTKTGTQTLSTMSQKPKKEKMGQTTKLLQKINL